MPGRTLRTSMVAARRRVRRHLVVVVVAAAALAGCDAHTVAIRFEPAVGDRYDFRSSIATDVTRTTDGETTSGRERSVLDATETVTAVDGADVTMTVQLERDGLPARGYTVRFDRSDRLSAIDLVGGVPAEAIGLDLSSELPRDVASPPDGPIESGARWTISRRVPPADGTGAPTVITGEGRIEALGVEGDRRVAVVVVDLRVPIRASVDTTNGAVTVRGVQTSRSRTTYDLADGTARRDHTEVTGHVDLVFAAPEGIVADPVDGRVDYTVVSDTERVSDLPR